MGPKRSPAAGTGRDLKTVLALSGGGAKGAFQSGAEETLRERYGLRWDGVVGMSVGAINGAAFAADQAPLLKQTWLTMENRHVYRGGVSPLSVLLCAVGLRPSIADSRPLHKLVNGTLERLSFVRPLRVIWVDLESGTPRVSAPADIGFEQALVASAILPIVFRPVRLTGFKGMGVDGGLTGRSPIGTAITELDAERVVYVTCRPKNVANHPQRNLGRGIQVALRTLDIAFQDMWGQEIESVQRVNRMLSQTQDTLRASNGRPYRPVDLIVIDPTRPLGDVLDFSASLNAERFRHGQERAEEVMESLDDARELA